MKVLIYLAAVLIALGCIFSGYYLPELSRASDMEMKRADAILYCQNLQEPGHAEHNDWKLPYANELETWEMLGQLKEGKYWTSDSSSDADKAWFYDAGSREEGEAPVSEPMRVVCIRWNGKRPPNHKPKAAVNVWAKETELPEKTDGSDNKECLISFTSNSDRTWCRLTKEEKLWKEADSDCGKLNMDGKKWRLPTVDEFKKLYDSGEFKEYLPDSRQRLWINSREYYWDYVEYGNDPANYELRGQSRPDTLCDSVCVSEN